MTGNPGLMVYGASDDLIEVEGCIREEFTATEQAEEEGDLLAFSTGVVLRVRYAENGVWRITPVAEADGVTITQAPEDDEANYSDRAFLRQPVAWVVHGTGYAAAQVAP